MGIDLNHVKVGVLHDSKGPGRVEVQVSMFVSHLAGVVELIMLSCAGLLQCPNSTYTKSEPKQREHCPRQSLGDALMQAGCEKHRKYERSKSGGAGEIFRDSTAVSLRQEGFRPHRCFRLTTPP